VIFLRCGTCYVGVHSVMVKAMGSVGVAAVGIGAIFLGVAAVCV
jgi:hypothetical protein